MNAPEVPLAERVGLTDREAAALLSLSPKTIQRARQSGALPAKRVGSSIRIRPADLAAWFDGLEDF